MERLIQKINKLFCPVILVLFFIPLNAENTSFIHSPPDQENMTESSPKEMILIFISLDLPEKTLKGLYQDAQENPTPTRLFLNKLYQNNLKSTTDRLKKLGIAVNIDSKWLNNLQTSTVPTFVFLKQTQGMTVLHGNMSLSFAKAQAKQIQPLEMPSSLTNA